jgi:hypothetical protein
MSIFCLQNRNVMINTNLMKFARLSFLILLSAGLTSCQTWEAIKNCAPVRAFDETGASMLHMLGENNLPANGKPASIQERARQVENRGIYAAGKTAPAAAAPRQSMVSR